MLPKDLRDIESVTAWSRSQYYNTTCSACHQSERPIYKTNSGSFCAFCIQPQLESAAETERLDQWTPSQFKEVLASQGNLYQRLTLLWRFEDVLRLIATEDKTMLENIVISLVRNLGYLQPHPLAQMVRQAAVEACIALGKPILPLLLQMCQPTPWQFYANVILTTGSIDQEDEMVKALLKKAAQDSKPEIRQYVLRAISDYNPAWTREILKAMLHDADPSVRKLADLVSKNALTPNNKVASATQPSAKQEKEQIYKIALAPRSARQTRLEQIIDAAYHTESLKKIYSEYLYHFFGHGNQLKKPYLVQCLATIYGNKELFEKLLSYLQQDVFKILEFLVWRGGKYEIKKLEKLFHTSIGRMERQYGHFSNNINYPYQLFQIDESFNYYDRYTYSLSMPDDLRKILKQYLPQPREYTIIPLESIKKTAFIYEDNDQILSQIKILCGYIEQGNLKTSKGGQRLLKNSVKQMTKSCQIKEFYDSRDKDLELIRTQLIAGFLRKADLKSVKNPAEFLRRSFNGFFNRNNLSFSRYNLLDELLFHLSGYSYKSSSKEAAAMTSLFNLLRSFPVSKWLAIEDMIKYCCYRDISLQIFDKADMRTLYYYKRSTSTYYSPYSKRSLSQDTYQEVVLEPLLKAIMFLLASFGLIDLAYNLPYNEVAQEGRNDYLCVFDGLQYMRLTKLGSYVLGLIEEYEVKVEEEKSNIVLDERRLIIHLEGKDMLKSLLLEKIGERMGENYYKVDYRSFLKQCHSKKEIEERVRVFHREICSDLPQIWQDFLSEVLKRVNPLSREQDMVVCKLKPIKELISLVAQDKVLKEYTLKGEDYRLMIESKNLERVRERLMGFGYFIDNL